MKSDLHSNAGSSSTLNLVFMSEQCNTSPPSSVIKCTFMIIRRKGRSRGQKNIPRVRTPSVVDFPLSTFPTTAQRTSGTSETLRGGSRRSRCIRGWSVRDSNSVETLPPICSTTLTVISRILSTSTCVRVTPIQPVSVIGSPEISWDSSGSAPIRKTYSPRCRVRREAVRSCALSVSSLFEESNSFCNVISES